MTASAELGPISLTVPPGGEATTTLTVRNETDIVEAYTLEVVGDCAGWTVVEPDHLSLYPGTSGTATVRLTPPRSFEVRAGDHPLGVKVLPSERAELVSVPEATVTVTPFRELRAELLPRRRRGWLRGRYRTSVLNLGNTDTGLTLTSRQRGEELRIALPASTPPLEPGESILLPVRVRIRKPVWFGKPRTWPFEVGVGTDAEDGDRADPPGGNAPHPLDGEFVQLPVFPKWLLAVLAALVALLILWLALVGPALRSYARQAANTAVAKKLGTPAPTPTPGGGTAGTGSASPGTGGTAGAGGGSGGAGGSQGTGGQPVAGTGVQSSTTIDVATSGGSEKKGTYQVPAGKVFGITDIVAANFQGDQGLLTISFGDRTITTIALETFRNQDYHWVTPIEVPGGATVSADVTCQKPGTPASGKQATTCHELLNVSGELSDLKQ
ncbi:hydrolytic protein [Streptomyces sp. SL13]|uniref:Hydrolytic protein n=1 Tax=Streptantibioticus silvisoli TaxID=2705255 RepID=A0AA90H522_9ACTN|nr:hydrolytic protein [Streptantibioticus silvisoli]MDI5961156.1 hydrolytic protein [Streptantibioticus silvisoli]MDI5970960.1 hydrolytic protein [Streptantibioticus silvisoli]